MIDRMSIVAMALTVLLSFVAPLVISVIYWKKKRPNAHFFAAGFVIYILFKMATAIPFLNLVTSYEWMAAIVQSAILYAVFAGAVMAVFEASGRYLYFRVFARSNLHVKNAVALGLGFGGFEAMVATGNVTVRRLVFSIMLNTGGYGPIQEVAVHPDFAPVIEEITKTGWHLILFAGIERVLWLAVHVGFSIMAAQAAKRDRLTVFFAMILTQILVYSALLFFETMAPATVFVLLVPTAVAAFLYYRKATI